MLLGKIKKHINKKMHKHLMKHLHKHAHKHVHKILHFMCHINHTFLHLGELIIVGIFGFTSLMFANFTGINSDLYRDSDLQVSQSLILAMSEPKTSMAKGNIISLRTMDNSVQNTFTPGYCTYGAARISPEFFPYLSGTQQQRTWGGNAIDRCENASQTGYKIGNTPIQGAFVVYGQGDKFGVYGHVGKIMHYDSKLKKMIVRDMAWVSKFTMSDRREDSDNQNIKCFIYPQRATLISEIVTGNNSLALISINQQILNNNIESVHSADNTITPIVLDNIILNSQTGETTQTLIQSQSIDAINPQNIILDFDNISDFAKHFISLRDIKLTLNGGNDLIVNQQSKLTISITNKKTGEKYKGLLTVPFGIITTNNNIITDYSSINLLDNGEIEVNLLAANYGTTSVIINFGEDKIAKMSFDIK